MTPNWDVQIGDLPASMEPSFDSLAVRDGLRAPGNELELNGIPHGETIVVIERAYWANGRNHSHIVDQLGR